MTRDREPWREARPWLVGAGSGLTAGGAAGAAAANGPHVTIGLGTPVQYGLLVLLCAVAFVVVACGFVVLARARRLFTESWLVRHDVEREDETIAERARIARARRFPRRVA